MSKKIKTAMAVLVSVTVLFLSGAPAFASTSVSDVDSHWGKPIHTARLSDGAEIRCYKAPLDYMKVYFVFKDGVIVDEGLTSASFTNAR